MVRENALITCLFSFKNHSFHNLDKLNNEQFKTYLNVLRLIIVKMPILDESNEQNEYLLAFSNDNEKTKQFSNHENQENVIDEDDEDEEEVDNDQVLPEKLSTNNRFNVQMDIDESNELLATKTSLNASSSMNIDETTIDEHKSILNNNKLNLVLLNDLLKIMDSKQFANKINNYFYNRSNININEFCMHLSHICYFVLIKSNLKMHQST